MSPTVDEQWVSTVVLGDGSTATIRPIRPSDADALREFHRRQPAENVYRRFFSPKPDLTPTELEHFTKVDMIDRVALVVEQSHGDDVEFLGWASYERWPGRADADTAFMVDDHQQGKGIATLLLEHLATIGESHGLQRFTAEVLADNRPMLAVFTRAGWEVERRYDSGIIEVDFPIEATEEFLDSVARREQRADSRAMARLLMPRTIAVIGASDDPGSVGDVLWSNISAAATGPVYAVNPNRTAIGDTPSYPRVSDVPDDVWLAVVAVPPSALIATMQDCAAAGVRGAVVLTAVDGTDIDAGALVADANRNGMRVIGPSSMGVASSRSDVGLNALLIPRRLIPGKVALSLQSGSLGSSVLRSLEKVGLGLSWFVSLGDRSDVSANDLLQFWEDDETTTAIGLYTEAVGNPRRFARIARRVSRRRPIVAVRTGAASISPSGGALYQHTGLIEVPTVTSMIDTLRLLATQPILRGRNVAVLANSRSPQTLAEAALITAGLLPVRAPVPLDWRATRADYASAINGALADDQIDGLLVIHAPPMYAEVGAPVAEIDAALSGAAKPATVVLLGADDGPLQPGSPVPAFTFPEPAAAVLGRSFAYGKWLDTEAAAVPVVLDDVDESAETRVEDIVAAAAGANRPVLDLADTITVLETYGLSMPATRYVAAGDAAEAAAAIGYPVAIKARHRHPGRSVEAGVALDVDDADDLAATIDRMGEALGDHADHVVVQAMAPPGVDLRIRVVNDSQVGPLVTVGLGGSIADLIGDDESRLAPLSLESAVALLGGSRAAVALQNASMGSGHIIDAIVRTAQLAADQGGIASIDLNPVIVTADGCCVTDAVIRVLDEPVHEQPIRRL